MAPLALPTSISRTAFVPGDEPAPRLITRVPSATLLLPQAPLLPISFTSRGRLVPRRPQALARGFDKLRGHSLFQPSIKQHPKPTLSEKCDQEAGSSAGGAEIDETRPVRVQATRGGKGGKTVTIITGLPAEQLQPLTKKLKSQCGSGGRVQGDTIELQGNHTDKLVELLRDLGFKNTKKSGG